MAHIVTIGGGTGTFVVLSGLKGLKDISLTAIVSGADDGGSTGRLRDAYGFLPLGDARQALVALAGEGTVMRELFAYRFAKGDVRGHNLGNLFLTALTDLRGTDSAALAEASRILRINGIVTTASDQPATLVATLVDGTVLTGEHLLDVRDPARSRIKELSYQNPVPLSPAAKNAIATADFLILGPGDLYASTAAALLATGMQDALRQSRARIIYIMNLFTKAGQTQGMTAADHVSEVTRYAGRAPDTILLHSDTTFDAKVLERYREEGELPVADDLPHTESVIRAPIASVHVVPPLPGDPVLRSLVRHDPQKLATMLAPLFHG